MSVQSVRVAAAQYCVDPLQDWAAIEAKLERWVEAAAREGARIQVFPEYSAFELFGVLERRQSERRSPDRHQLGSLPIPRDDRRITSSIVHVGQAIQPLIERYLGLFASLAAKYRVYILAGSLPLMHSDGSLTNTAFLFAPDGTMSSQDKLVLTRWEREVWKMRGGTEVRVFDTEFGPIGIDICYDIEFPIVARRQAEARARIILAPCCCDSLRGYYRVRVGARARALENQAYVVQSPLIGSNDWLPSVGRCVGRAGIYAPPDLGPRENGVLAEGSGIDAVWTYADLDLRAVDRIRGEGVIANGEEWESHAAIGQAVTAKFTEFA